MKKRIISLFLCFVMLAGVLPTGSFTVFAEGEEETEEVTRPTVNQSAQTVTLSDGTVLYYDEAITVTPSMPYAEGHETDEVYESCLWALHTLLGNLDADKVYYIKLDTNCKFSPFQTGWHTIDFNGVNVILDLNGHRIENKAPGVTTSLIKVRNCGLFALISSWENDVRGTLLKENSLDGGDLLDVRDSNLIIDGYVRIEHSGPAKMNTHIHYLRAENSSVKILDGSFYSYSGLHAVRCPDVTIRGGWFGSSCDVEEADANIRLEGTKTSDLHIYGGTFARVTNYAPIVGEAVYYDKDEPYAYKLPDGVKALHYRNTDDLDAEEPVCEWSDNLKTLAGKYVTKVTTPEDAEAEGLWHQRRLTLHVLKPEDFYELYTFLEDTPANSGNDVTVIFYTDMALPTNLHYGGGEDYVSFDINKFDRIKLDLNGYDIFVDGGFQIGAYTELTVTDSSAKEGRRPGSLSSDSSRIIYGKGTTYLDNIHIYCTNPNANPTLFSNDLVDISKASVNHVTTHFNPFYGYEKLKGDILVWCGSYLSDVTGCTVTIDGETYDLKDWAVSNGYATYKKSRDALEFSSKATRDLDISECLIDRHPTISTDSTVETDKNGDRVIYADGFAPVLKANNALPSSEVTWGYLPPNGEGYPFAMNQYVGNVTDKNCALAYHPEGGKYRYFLIVDGEVVDEICVIYSPLKGIRLISEISPEGVFLEETRSTCANLTASYAGALLEGETMTSLTFRILNSISTMAFNKEVTLYNGDQITFPQDFYVNYPRYEAIDGGVYRIQVIGKTSTGRTLEGGIVTFRADVPATSVTFEYDYRDFYNGAYHVSDPDAGIGSLELKFTPENASSLPGGLFLECDTVSDGGDVVAWDGEKLVLTGVPGTTTITAKSGNGTVSSEPITVVVPVTDVEVNGVVPPKYGSEMNTGYLYVPDDAPYTIRDAYWEYPADDGYVRVEAGSTPMLNRDYRLSVDLALKPGYQVPSVYEEGTGEYAYGAVYGNGVSCTVSAMNSLGLGVLDASASGNTNGTPYDLTDDYISVTYHYGYVFNENATEIDTVYVEFEAPRDGQTYEQWYKSVKFSCAYADEVEWGLSVSSKNEMFEVLGWKFVGNMYYTLTFNGYLGDSNGAFRFADKVTFIVNGESYEKNSTLDGRYVFSPNLSILAVGDPGYKPVTKLSVQPVTLTLDGSVNLNDYYTVETEGKLSVFAHSYYFNYDAETGTLSATEAFKSFAGTNPEYINGFIYLEIGFDKNSDGEYNIRFRYNIPVRILSGSLPNARQYRVKLGNEDGYAYSFAPLVGDTIYYLPVQIEGSLASKSTSTAGTPVYDPISGLYSLKTPDTSVSARNVVTVSYISAEDVDMLKGLNDAEDAAIVTVDPDYHWRERSSGNAGWLYSIDGVNWQDSPRFEGLPTGTEMTVYFKQGIFGDIYSVTGTTAGDHVTPPASKGSLSGTVTSYQSETETVLIQLIKEGSTEAAYEASVTGNSASYEIKGIEAGIYMMKVMKKNHVTREYTVVVLDTAVTQDAKIHLLGDINGDGKVNTSDVGKANAHAKKTALLTGYELACADVNGDGRVNTSDVGKLNAHAKKTSLLW